MNASPIFIVYFPLFHLVSGQRGREEENWLKRDTEGISQMHTDYYVLSKAQTVSFRHKRTQFLFHLFKF